MAQSLYEIVALGARYLFAGLMVLIVLRAWRITLVDSRRASTLRHLSPQTGIIGELLVLEGDEKARRGMKYPVIREGMIGSSRRADIRVRHSSVRRRHAYFQFTEAGLAIRTHAGAPMRDANGRPVRSLVLPDGGEFVLGRVRLLLVLTEAPEPVHRRAGRREDDEPYADEPYTDETYADGPYPDDAPRDDEQAAFFDVDDDFD